MNQLPLWHHVIISFLLCFAVISAQQDNCCDNAVVLTNNTVVTEVIKQLLPAPIVIDKLSFESDVVFQTQEFLHLFGFDNGSHINSQDLIAALERCAKKHKFLHITMTSSVSDAGVWLHFVMESAWTFRKIKIHNVYQGKHALLQFYLMERGDLFDESKHTHSLNKIKESLINNGYFDCSVTSSLAYDYQTKEVIVHIVINKGKRFSFGSIDVELVMDDGISAGNEELCKVIKKKISQALSSRTFIQEHLNSELVLLKDYLAKKGFFHSVIDVDQKVDHQHTVVHTRWEITITHKREIIFFGHRFFSKKELLEKMLAFGQSVWLLPATLLAEEIIRT